MSTRTLIFAIAISLSVGLAISAIPPRGGFLPLSQSGNRGADVREILRNYEVERNAHFHHDAAALLASHDVTWYRVADGTVAPGTLAGEKARVQQYLDSVNFSEVSDIDPPHVEVSADGMMAWLMGHVRVRGTRAGEKGADAILAFDAAWIDVWEKKADGWRIVARANTEKNVAVSP